MKRLSAWWWSLETSPWYIARLLFLIAMFLPVIYVIAHASIRDNWAEAKEVYVECLRGDHARS